jgi:hypothetical protein
VPGRIKGVPMRRTSKLLGLFSLALATLVLAGGDVARTQNFRPPPGHHPLPALPDMRGIWTKTGIAFDPAPVGPTAVKNTVFSRQVWVGDHTNPILRPHVAEVVRRNGQADLVGDGPMTPTQLCRPSGVPNILNVLGHMQVLQTPDMVVFLYDRDQVARFIYLNAEHPKDLKPSYFGHSIGWYEGDQLVVDTVGFNDKTPTDRFGTPHSDKLHVVERYRIIDEWTTLQVYVTVEDPESFTTPWSAMSAFRRGGNAEWSHDYCQENNRKAEGGYYPIPMDETPDF